MFILGPRSVRRFGADIFVAPWDLITPPGVMHYHFATRSRILCAGQALRACPAHPLPRGTPAKKNKLPLPCAEGQTCCSVHVAPRGWRRVSLGQPYQTGATKIPVYLF